jgi:hypothetical protein
MRVNLSAVIIIATVWFVSSTSQSYAQGTTGSDATIESRYLVDLPTAGIISHGNVALDFEFFQSNGMLAGVAVGAFDRLLLGLSFGGSNIIGTDRPTWNTAPGVQLKLRLLEETVFIPAIAIGFSSQGKETYIDRLNRYTVKSPGFYAVASKNYSTMGFLSLHGGVNYSLERSDNDDDINLFVGAEKTLGPFLSVIGEYDLGINDSNRDALGRGRGYLNLALKASAGNGFMIGIVLKDVLQNQQDISLGNRVIQLEYVR